MNTLRDIRTIAIHQPHFMAWLPYYCRISSAHTYIVLDDVSFRRHFFHDRSFLVDKNSNIIHCKLPSNGSQNILIKDVCLINSEFYFDKILKSILYTYKKQPYFDEFYFSLREYKEKFIGVNKLLEFNLLFMLFVFDHLKINPPEIDFSSNLSTSHERNQRIIEICEKTGKSIITCGWGASTEIHDLGLLLKNKITFTSLSKDEFTHILDDYKLIDGVSIVDVLIKKGVSFTRNIFSNCLYLYNEKINEQDQCYKK